MIIFHVFQVYIAPESFLKSNLVILNHFCVSLSRMRILAFTVLIEERILGLEWTMWHLVPYQRQFSNIQAL